MKYLLIITTIVLFFSTSLEAQNTYTKYWLSFSDKHNTPYSVKNPSDYLSDKAIARRHKHRIAITTHDLPVNPQYLGAVKQIEKNVLRTSKWFNGVLLQIDDAKSNEVLLALQSLPFVKRVVPVAKLGTANQQNEHQSLKKQPGETLNDAIYYGTAFHQVQMLNGDYLHAAGYTGEGLTCAIIDAGFTNVDELSVFERLFDNGQILGTFDFVEGDADVFGHNAHGTHVFTIMGANEPGVYVGAAPDANYWLFRTEDAASETLLEEYNWLAAAEFADSVGVDLINSSLGYSTFDNTSNNHSYADMDGNTTVISKAADMAASKGILVVVSAGNQGNKPWHYVTAPADADSVLSVGAVDSLKQYVSFSSVGPSADGQIKPNIVGQGHNTAYVGTDGNLKHGNGTSFSAPLIAGLATCLWQAYPEKNNMDIIGLIESSASQAQNPDNHLGYGIPNFYTAMLQGNNDPILNFDEEMVAFVYPNPFANDASIYYYANLNEIITLQLYDYTGRLLASYATEVRVDTPYKFDFPNWVKYPKGAYLIKIISDQQQKNLKSIKVGN